MTRRLLRWTMLVVTLGLVGQMARWLLAERRSHRRLALTTTPWPDVEAPPSSPRALPQRGTRIAGPDGARTGADPTARPHGTLAATRESTPAGAARTPPATSAITTTPLTPPAPRPQTPRPGGAGTGGPAPTTSGVWVAPAGRSCPPGYPVKAKLRSRLYHLPGMAAYERTGPDRCYATAEAAEADGFARAKR